MKDDVGAGPPSLNLNLNKITHIKFDKRMTKNQIFINNDKV